MVQFMKSKETIPTAAKMIMKVGTVPKYTYTHSQQKKNNIKPFTYAKFISSIVTYVLKSRPPTFLSIVTNPFSMKLKIAWKIFSFLYCLVLKKEQLNQFKNGRFAPLVNERQRMEHSNQLSVYPTRYYNLFRLEKGLYESHYAIVMVLSEHLLKEWLKAGLNGG